MSKKSTNGRISFGQYRLTDLMIFLLIMGVCEMVNVFAITKWFSNMMFSVSVMLLVTLTVLVRWNWLGIIFPIIDALLYCWLYGAEAWQFAQYIIGNAAVSLILLLFLVVPKEKLISKWYLTVGYAVIGYALLVFGRASVAACYGFSFGKELVGILTGELINFLFALLGLLVLRRLDGMLCDQKKYVERITTERDTIKRPEEYKWDGYTELNEDDLAMLSAMDDYDGALKGRKALKEMREQDIDEGEDLQ